MSSYEGPRSRLPDIPESKARRYIKEAKDFFIKNPDILTIKRYRNSRYRKKENGEAPEAFIEAYRLIRQLNFSAKSLLAKGGKIPPILGELTSLFNKLHLACGGQDYRSYKELLGEESFDAPLEDDKGIVRITDFVALRAAEDICQFPPLKPKEYQIDKENGELIPTQITPVRYLDDALHIGFETTLASARDLGWISTDYSVEYAKTMAKKGPKELGWLQGGIWRHTEVAENIRNRYPHRRGKSYITLISERDGVSNIRSGTLPSFNKGKLGFGRCDVTKKEEAERYRTEKTKGLKKTLEQNANWLIETIRQELQGALGQHLLGDKRPVAGGRRGLNPAYFYLNPE